MFQKVTIVNLRKMSKDAVVKFKTHGDGEYTVTKAKIGKGAGNGVVFGLRIESTSSRAIIDPSEQDNFVGQWTIEENVCWAYSIDGGGPKDVMQTSPILPGSIQYQEGR